MTAPVYRFLLLALLFAAAATPCHADDPQAVEKDFKTWLNDTIVNEVKLAVSTRSNANQSEAPSLGGNTSSLVDTSSASDLIGMALNIAGLTSSSESDTASDTTTATATASAYALYSALRGVDPLDPGNYCGTGPLGAARYWRRASVTLGFDDDTSKDSAIIVGGKGILWTQRDVCSEDFSGVQKALEGATQRVSQISIRIEDQLYDLYRKDQLGIRIAEVDNITGDTATDERRRKIAFINKLADKTVFTKALEALGPDPGKTFFTTEDIDALVRLDAAAREKIAAFRGQPQLSASLQTKQRDQQGDDYRAEVIFDYGLNDRLALSLNGSYENKDADQREQGGRVAAAFHFEPFTDPLFGPKPLRFTLSGEGQWMEGTAPVYKGQLKLNLPIPRLLWLSGVELPLSVTIANRSDLVDETEVRGLIGFTVDTSQLLAAVRR